MARTPDAFGNVHNRYDHRGLVVFRDPGRYAGRHRAHRPATLLALLTALLDGRRV